MGANGAGRYRVVPAETSQELGVRSEEFTIVTISECEREASAELSLFF